MDELEQRIYNEGERLIPFVTHDMGEVVRHKSSYAFFRRVIETDRARLRADGPTCVVDLGCGVGHGCFDVAQAPGTRVTGIDRSAECVRYAAMKFPAPNVEYRVEDLVEFVPRMPEFDYVVSRGVLEHIPGGLELAVRSRWRQRLMFDVPYDEPEGNPHHLLLRLREEQFAAFPRAELFFEDLQGVIFDASQKPVQANMILCVCSAEGLPSVAKMLGFPMAAWSPDTGWRARLGAAIRRAGARFGHGS